VNTATQEAPGEAEIADYLANRLSEAEAQAFELYCLEHPDFAQLVEREIALKIGMRQTAAASVQPSITSHYRGLGRWPVALAASIVVIVCAMLAVRYSMERQTRLVAFTSAVEMTDNLRGAPVSLVNLLRVRGHESTTQVSASVNGVIELRLLPDSISSVRGYSLQIAREGASPRQSFIVRNLKSTTDGFVQVYLPAKQMIGGTWLISLAEDGDARSLQNASAYRVQFVVADGGVNE
jgi:hypothetical protein